jgi:hypothetical protein
MSLPPPTVEDLQTAWHTRAKGSPADRFDAWYAKVYRRDVLGWADVALGWQVGPRLIRPAGLHRLTYGLIAATGQNQRPAVAVGSGVRFEPQKAHPGGSPGCATGAKYRRAESEASGIRGEEPARWVKGS